MHLFKISKISSLKKQLFAISCIALCVSLFFYFFLSNLAAHLLDKHFETKERTETLEKLNMNRLQEFVTENNLSIRQLDEIDKWVYENEYIFLKIFANNSLLYDSIYGITSVDTPLPEQVDDFPKTNYYPLNFSDTQTYAVIVCMNDYVFYTYVNYILLVLSFVVFFIILSYAIHKKIGYLVLLKKELDILTEKDLTTPVSVLGNDEISCVAQSMESLRLRMIDKIAKERLAYESNRNLITSLSHDIRTPLTSLIAYLELTDRKQLLKNRCNDYISVSLDKAYHLKELTDQLFEHFLLDSQKDKTSKELVNGNELVVQMIEESLFDLELQNVKVVRKVEDISCSLYVSINLIHRLFDNIFSNINKYADLTKSINIEYYIRDDYLIISFHNYICIHQSEHISTHIGLKNCMSIMEIHSGKFETEESSSEFSVTIYLPIEEAYNSSLTTSPI